MTNCGDWYRDPGPRTQEPGHQAAPGSRWKMDLVDQPRDRQPRKDGARTIDLIGLDRFAQPQRGDHHRDDRREIAVDRGPRRAQALDGGVPDQYERLNARVPDTNIAIQLLTEIAAHEMVMSVGNVTSTYNNEPEMNDTPVTINGV